jgi:hypothetical protein
MTDSLARAEAIAQAKIEAANAQLRATLLEQPAAARGCSEDTCPGPRASQTGGCPMGWAGSCRRAR